MTFRPFPPEYAQASAESAGRTNDAQIQARRKEMRRQRRTYFRPQDYKLPNVACYKTPEGRIQLVYDLYRAEYPEGTEPGMGDFDMKVKWHANNTHSYEPIATRFRTLSELEREQSIEHEDDLSTAPAMRI